MLYFLNGITYTGSYGPDNSAAAREAAQAQGLTPVWFDTEPAFHTRWVNTPATAGEAEIRIDLTLTEYKEVRLAELSEYAGQFDQYKCDAMFVTSSVGGYRFNADIRSQTNIKGLLELPGESFAYRDYDNVFRSLTKAELQTLYNECLANGANLYQQKWAKQEAINSAISKEDLDKIEIVFTMMDFSALA